MGIALLAGKISAWQEVLGFPLSSVRRQSAYHFLSSTSVLRWKVDLQDGNHLEVRGKMTSAHEVQVYRRMRDCIPLRLPFVYYAEEVALDGLLICESLPPGKPASQWKRQDVCEILSGLARLHAAFWESRVTDLSWIETLSNTLAQQWPIARRGLDLLKQIGGWPGLIDLPVIQTMEALVGDPEHLLAPLAGIPTTLLHGDAWQPNWICLPEGCALLDWQTAMRGPGIWDVVYFLELSGEAGCVLPIDEEEAIEVYLEELEGQLTRNGVCPQEAASGCQQYRAAWRAVSVLQTLTRWPLYAPDYLGWVEKIPTLVSLWRVLPQHIRFQIGKRMVWAREGYYRRTFEHFEERAQIVYGAGRSMI